MCACVVIGAINCAVSGENMTDKEIAVRLDKIFGNCDSIVALIKEGKWTDAAKFCDYTSYKCAMANDDWWWNQIRDIAHIDYQVWNSTSFGNVALAVVCGEQHPERAKEVAQIKALFGQ